MATIQLPDMKTLWGDISYGGKGNTYSGSFGTDPATGFVNRTTFEYRANIKWDNKTIAYQIYAAHFNRPPWREYQEKHVLTIARFEASEHGRILAQEWLNKDAKSYQEKYGRQDERKQVGTAHRPIQIKEALPEPEYSMQLRLE